MKKIIILLAIGLFLSLTEAVTAQESLSVIVNNANTVGDINQAKLARIYRGEDTTWSNGQGIVIVNQTMDTDARAKFYSKVLKESPSNKFYISGTMAPIRATTVKGDGAVKLFVSNNVNAIGYISAGAVDGMVKVLAIDGSKAIY